MKRALRHESANKSQQAKTSPSPIFVKKKKKKNCILEHGEGIQNTPLQYQNYCELKTFENQQIQEEASLHFPHLPKSRPSERISLL